MAERLGLGERQLRRLFRQHLGASPVGVAQTRRILLAKQLIHETRLPMAEIAFASGFGSVRRFNEAFLALFARAPGELRRLGGEDVAVKADGEFSLLLRYQPPYEWPAMLEFLRQRAISGLEGVSDGRYWRTVFLDGIQGSLSIEPGPGNALRAGIRVSKLSIVPSIIARLRRVFDLAADPLAIAQHLSKDPLLAPLVEKRPGLRVPGAWDGFELAIRAVLGQQITVTAAVRLAARLVATYGAPMTAPAPAIGLTHFFPEPGSARSRGLDDSGHAQKPRGDALGGGSRVARESGAVREQLRARRGGAAPARDPRGRRMDRAVHRSPSAARARRLPCLGSWRDPRAGRRSRTSAQSR